MDSSAKSRTSAAHERTRMHTKFNVPVNRVGQLLTLDELVIIWSDAERLIEKRDKSLSVSVIVSSGMVELRVENDIDFISISQRHMFPQALIVRGLGSTSKIKTPTAKRIEKLTLSYL